MKKRRRNLPFWGILLIWLVMSTGFTIYQWFLIRQDEVIAPREQVVLGTIYKTTHWKQDKAFYRFTYAGRKYRGNEMVGPDKMCLCNVAVYFDPTHPSTNTLVEYGHKEKQDHSVMVDCGYASAVLALALACLLGLKKRRGRLIEGVTHADSPSGPQ